MVAFIDSVFSDGIEQKLIPGGVTALVSQQRMLMLKGYGLSNVESNIPVSIDSTLFQLGSVGKLFTSIALLQNIEHHYPQIVYLFHV